VRLAFEPGTAERITNRFCGPLPAVGHRHHFDLRVRQHIEQPFRDVLRDLARVQRAFEFIGSDKNSHSYNFITNPMLSFRAKQSGVEESLETKRSRDVSTSLDMTQKD
jgi:hypothetical protein